MKNSIKKYQSSLLASVCVALLSAPMLSQANQEWHGSIIKLCGDHVGYLGEHGTAGEESSVRIDLRKQAYVGIRSHAMGYTVGPRYLIDEVSIVNTNPNNPINLYDVSIKLKESDSFYVLSSLKIRSFDLDPEQILTGKTTIWGPGLHYVNEVTVRFGDLPINEVSYIDSCEISHIENVT